MKMPLLFENTDARGMTLRVLCTAADASQAWDLRCDVHEALIDWLNTNQPDCLPRMRAELARDDRVKNDEDESPDHL